MRTIVGILFFVTIHTIGSADEIGLRFEQANHLYRNGDFQKAAELYEQILAHDYESPELYYNLGNAYFKLNNLPAAILNYERAKRLTPRDEDIEYNLRLAQVRVIDKIEPLPRLFFVDWWYAITNVFPADRWATIALVALWLVALSIAGFIVGRTFLHRFAGIVSVCSAFICATAFLSALQRSAIEQEQSAVIFSPSVFVKSAPDRQSTDLFMLHEGVKVELVDSVGQWKKIRLPDGKVGWLPDESIEVI